MNEGIISARYAKTLYELAADKNVLDAVRNDIDFIHTLLHQVQELQSYLTNPVIKPGSKYATLESILKGVQPITLAFLHLLIKNNREIILDFIALRFIREYKERKGIKHGVLTTTVEIDDTLRKSILEKMDRVFKCQIELECLADEKLIGGFIFRLEDQQFDGSVATRLSTVQRKLMNIQIKK